MKKITLLLLFLVAQLSLEAQTFQTSISYGYSNPFGALSSFSTRQNNYRNEGFVQDIGLTLSSEASRLSSEIRIRLGLYSFNQQALLNDLRELYPGNSDPFIGFGAWTDVHLLVGGRYSLVKNEGFTLDLCALLGSTYSQSPPLNIQYFSVTFPLEFAISSESNLGLTGLLGLEAALNFSEAVQFIIRLDNLGSLYFPVSEDLGPFRPYETASAINLSGGLAWNF